MTRISNQFDGIYIRMSDRGLFTRLWSVEFRNSPTIPLLTSSASRWGALALFAVLVLVRMPDVVIDGRLWAEEGYFLQNAWTMPWYEAMTAILGGYLNIVANAAGLLARYLVPIRDTPWITTSIGFLFQLTPALILVTSRAAWLRHPAALAAALLLIATVVGGEEVWLNTLHAQFHLMLCASLILAFDDVVGRPVRLFRRALLLLATLCGPSPVLLLPLFMLRTVLERSPERLKQTLVLAFGIALQLFVFYSPESAAAYGRHFQPWPGLLLLVFYVHMVVVPFFGETAAWSVGAGLKEALLAGNIAILPLLVLAVWGGTLTAVSIRHLRHPAIWLFASAVLLAFVSYAGAIYGGSSLLQVRPNERYHFVPQALIGLMLVSLWQSHPSRLVTRASLCAVLWLAFLGIYSFSTSRSIWLASGPNWHQEVRLWEANPQHAIRLWPEGYGFDIALPTGAR